MFLFKKFRHPLVSVIVPAYNAEGTIADSVKSVLAQGYGNIEVICVDDGSTDGTAAVLDGFRLMKKSVVRTCGNERIVCVGDGLGGTLRMSVPPVRVFSIPHSGIAAARNEGLRRARGRYIMWCDADDRLAPMAVGRMVEAVSGVDMAVCNIACITPENLSEACRKNEGPPYFSNGFLRGAVPMCAPTLALMNLVLWNKIFRKSVIRKNRLRFDEAMAICEDILFTGLYSMCSRSVRFVDDALYTYVRSDNSTMGRIYARRGGRTDMGLAEACAFRVMLDMARKNPRLYGYLGLLDGKIG